MDFVGDNVDWNKGFKRGNEFFGVDDRKWKFLGSDCRDFLKTGNI